MLYLRSYQKEAIDAILKYKQGIEILPTGAGKSVIGIGFLMELMKQYDLVEYYILVPTSALVTQWYKNLKKYNVPLTGKIITYQSFVNLTSRSNLWGNIQIEHAMIGYQPKTVRVIIIDEVHHAHIGSKLLKSVSNSNADYILGLTATINPHAHYTLPIIFKKSMVELQEYLAEMNLRKIPVELDEQNKQQFLDTVLQVRNTNVAMSVALKRGDMEKYNALSYRLQTLLGILPYFIATDPHVIDITTERALAMRGRTLIKTNRKVAALTIYTNLLSNGIPNDKILYYQDKSQIDAISNEDWQYLITVKALSEGIDVPDIQNVILSSYDYSYVLNMIQTIGRALRPSPEKEKADVYVLVPDVPQYINAYSKLERYLKTGS